MGKYSIRKKELVPIEVQDGFMSMLLGWCCVIIAFGIFLKYQPSTDKMFAGIFAGFLLGCAYRLFRQGSKLFKKGKEKWIV